MRRMSNASFLVLIQSSRVISCGVRRNEWKSQAGECQICKKHKGTIATCWGMSNMHITNVTLTGLVDNVNRTYDRQRSLQVSNQESYNASSMRLVLYDILKLSKMLRLPRRNLMNMIGGCYGVPSKSWVKTSTFGQNTKSLVSTDKK